MVEKTSGWDSKNLWFLNHPDLDITQVNLANQHSECIFVAAHQWQWFVLNPNWFDGCSKSPLGGMGSTSNLNPTTLFFCVEEVEILINQWQHTHTLIQCVLPKKDVFKACLNWKWTCMWLIMTGYHYQLLQKFSTVKDGKINWAMCVVLIRSSTCSKAVPGKRLVSAFYLSW